jgi:hypothetical protein
MSSRTDGRWSDEAPPETLRPSDDPCAVSLPVDLSESVTGLEYPLNPQLSVCQLAQKRRHVFMETV